MERKIRNKSLFNKACKLKNLMLEIINKDLQFEAQDVETKRSLCRATDELRAFIDNII